MRSWLSHPALAGLLAAVASGCTGSTGVTVGDMTICLAPALSCGNLCIDPMGDARNCGGCGVACGPGQACVGGKCGTQCPGGQTVCDGACANLMSDPLHCGDCKTACPIGNVCANGRCGLSCLPGQKNCSGACVNPLSDNANCGGCGMACPPGQLCSNGACGVTCQQGLMNCGGLCVNLKSDNANCGGCATACPPGNVCSNGVCGVTCQIGYTNCNGVCANPLSDNANCGACGTVCPLGNFCSNGVCGVTCQIGLTLCGGLCVNAQSDPANCGGCGTVCPPGNACSMGACGVNCQVGLMNCGGVCANLQNDVQNCGKCQNPCPMGQTCAAGVCAATCQNPQQVCNGVCVDERFDPMNCGACANACMVPNSTPGCSGGVCIVGMCTKGFLDCNSKVADGCEVNSTNDNANCAACGKSCSNSQACCNSACINVINDPANCGGCGIACKQGQRCCSGVCLDPKQVPLCNDCARPCQNQNVKGNGFAQVGTLTNLGADMNGVGTIVNKMGGNPPQTPYVWVVMHDSNQANKFDAKSGKLLGTFPTGGVNPSRSSLALDGSFWIAHRCPGDPNNPACSNVTQMQADGTLSCIITKAADGQPMPFNRAIAIDAQGFVWVGTWNDSRAHKIDPVACKTVLDVPLPGNPYGFAIDSKGLLWTSTIGSGPYAAIDTLQGKVVYTGSTITTYGVVIDRKDNVFWAQWCGAGIYRMDGGSRALTFINNPSGRCNRGMAIDTDGNIWGAEWTGGATYVSKWTGGTGAYITSYNIPGATAGVGISGDAYGKMWISSGNYGGGGQQIYRFSKDTGVVDLSTAMPGSNAYNYSDWIGYALRTVVTQNGQIGTWVDDFDSGSQLTQWQTATWTATIPMGATVQVKFRAAQSQPALAKAPYCLPFTTSPADLTKCNFGAAQWLEAQMTLTTNSDATPPVVSDFFVYYQ